MALIRESQSKDSDLKVIIDLLRHKPYEMGSNSLIGYFLCDGVLYTVYWMKKDAKL